MKKAMTASIVALMALSLLSLTYVYIKPAQFEGKNAVLYQFIETAEQKKISLFHLSSQAVTEAIADYSLDKTVDPDKCIPTLDTTEMTERLEKYIGTINDFPDHKTCNVKLEKPIQHNGYDVNVSVTVNCSLLEPSGAFKAELEKKYDFRKRIKFMLIAPDQDCYVRVIDLGNLDEFVQ